MATDPPDAPSHAFRAEIAVAPDDDLAKAITDAPPGATLVLGPGTHTLSGPVVVVRALRLRGAGRDLTRVVSHAVGVAIRVSGARHFAAAGLTFEHAGDIWAHVMLIDDAEVAIEACRFRDAKRHPSEDVGDGLRLCGHARGFVVGCEFVDNGHHGLVLAGHADVAIEGGEFRDNAGAGLCVRDAARGTIVGGVAERNRLGVACSHDAAPLMLDVVARANATSGFAWRDQAAGRAIACRAEANRDGFVVVDAAAPALDAPVALANREHGLRAGDAAAPRVVDGRFRENGGWGAYVGGEAAPTFLGCVACGNARGGLAWLDDARGRFERGLVEANRGHGLEVHQRARPSLGATHVRANGWDGLAYRDQAAGEAGGNLFERNAGHGVSVADQAAPTLHGNLARANGDHGFRFGPGAGGAAHANGATANANGAYLVETKRFRRKPLVRLEGNADGPIPIDAGPPAGDGWRAAALDPAGDGPVGRIVVAPGDDLDAVLRTAPPGALVQLAAGEHRLRPGAARAGDLVLHGAGRANTTIRHDAAGPLLRFMGPGKLVLAGLALVRGANGGGNVLEAVGGEVELDGCAVRGGRRTRGKRVDGHGVLALGHCRVALRRCAITENEGYGVASADARARIVAEGCELGGNGAGEQGKGP